MDDEYSLINIDNFEAIARQSLENFLCGYREGIKLNPEHYPPEQAEGDWWEQFILSQDPE